MVAAYEWIAGYGSYNAKQPVAVWDRQTGACRSEPPVEQAGFVLAPGDFATGVLLTCRMLLWVPAQGGAVLVPGQRHQDATAIHGTTAVALSYGGEAWRAT